MSIPKAGQAQDTRRSQGLVDAKLPGHVPGKRTDEVEILDLTGSEEFNAGGDPYNSVGQQVITELRKTAANSD